MVLLFPLDVLDEICEIWDLIESVSEGFPTYFSLKNLCFGALVSPRALIINIISLLA